MGKPSAKAVVPRLRFPDFRRASPWPMTSLERIGERITKKNGDGRVERVLTNSAEFGVLDQRDYFDKDIATAGKVEGYYIVEKGDYVYNPRTSAIAPVGPISRNNLGEGVMSPLYTVFRFSSDLTDFYAHYFKSTGWHSYLRSAASTGARHDRMSITTSAFMRMPLPAPVSAEQQKIADCLTSLDEVIAAQARKVEALKAHKRGLMQQLFPREGETVPRLRFPEFRDAPAWEEAAIGSRSKSFSGGTPSTTNGSYYGGQIPFIRSAEIGSATTELHLTELGLRSSAAKLVEQGDVLVALYGANSGDVALAKTSGAINQAILCIRPECSNAYLYHFFSAKKSWVVATFIQGGQGNLSGEIIKSLILQFPSAEEQQRIADCLSSLDNRISAESDQLAALKTHKQGLMQQLFPAPDVATV